MSEFFTAVQARVRTLQAKADQKSVQQVLHVFYQIVVVLATIVVLTFQVVRASVRKVQTMRAKKNTAAVAKTNNA